jgi:hypothetical protein
MADIRTLKLALLADTKNFIDGLDKADKETQTFSDKLGSALKAGATAFLALGAAAGAAAIKIGIDGVKAAIEDEKAQVALAQALKNTTNATSTQIMGVEKYIDATARATGVTDDQLRPSLERLLRSTESITKAQELQTLALDIARGTGKDLASVSDALGRAYEGQYKGLKDLGIELKTSITTTSKAKVSKEGLAKAETAAEGATLRVTAAQEKLNKILNNASSDALDVARAQNALEAAQQRASDSTAKFESQQSKLGKTITSTKEVAVSFDSIVSQLTDKFGGQAAAYTETFAGRMDLVKVSLSEAKETLGYALLPLLEKFATFTTETLVPALDDFVAGLTGGSPNSVKNALRDAKGRVIEFNDGLDDTIGKEGSGAYGLGIAVQELAKQFGFFNDEITGANGETGLKKFIENMTSLLEIVNALIEPFRILAEFSQKFAETQQANNMAAQAGAAPYQKNIIDRAIDSVVINVKGAIDPQGVARTVTKVLGTASKTTGIKVPQSALSVGLR